VYSNSGRRAAFPTTMQTTFCANRQDFTSGVGCCALGCKNLCTPDGKPLLLCSGCRTSVYCSHKCPAGVLESSQVREFRASAYRDVYISHRSTGHCAAIPKKSRREIHPILRSHPPYQELHRLLYTFVDLHRIPTRYMAGVTIQLKGGTDSFDVANHTLVLVASRLWR
jgi:hypothetical protein